ncbi:MAG TPA: hypothetical protein VKH65_10505, partial [Myxococcales bacterium]|nr:hypothetical protein [Myxococcales bacterium]
MDALRALLAEGRSREAEEAVERAVAEAVPSQRGRVLQEAGSAALKAGEPRLAAGWFRRAGELLPRDPE